MTKRNMKIEINKSQQLDEVVRELERIHGVEFKFTALANDPDLWILFNSSRVSGWSLSCDLDLFEDYKSTTLTELKEMK